TGLARCGLDAVAVLKEKNTEAVETGVLQREAVLGFVHAKAARPAGARGEENIIVEDVLARDSFFLATLEVLNQIADREIGRIGGALVAVFVTDRKGGHVGAWQRFAAVAAALEDGADQVLVLPVDPAKEDGDFAALFSRKGALHRTVEVGGPVQAGNF